MQFHWQVTYQSPLVFSSEQAMLVGDGDDAPADNLDADRIERVGLASAPYGARQR
jgi:hypothetical protein